MKAVLASPAFIAALVFALGLTPVLLFLKIATPILFALALSVLWYAAMMPAVDALVRRDIKLSIAIALVMIVVVVLMLGITSLLYPTVSRQFDQFSLRIGDLDTRVASLYSQLAVWLSVHWGIHMDSAAWVKNTIDQLGRTAASMESSVRSYFNSVAFSLILVPMITFFLLRDYRTLRNGALQHLPNRYFEVGWMVYNVATGQLQSYARGIFIQSIVMTSICTVGFWLAGIDYAPVLGLLVGLLNLIPFFGISLAKLPPVIIVLLSDHPDLLSILLALAVVFAAQIVDTVYLMPRVVAKSANLHPLTVIIGVMLAGYYFGFVALILVVPVLFSMKVIYLELLRGIRDFHVGALEH